MDTGGWWVFTPWGYKESLTTEQLFFLILGGRALSPACFHLLQASYINNSTSSYHSVSH